LSQQQLGRALSTMQDDLCRARERKAQLEQELAILTGAIAATGHSPSIVEAIGERERELRSITKQLLGNEQQAVTPKLDELRQFVTERLMNIHTLLNCDVERARAELGKHVTGTTLQPQQGHYVALGEWNLLGKQPAACDSEGMRVWVVAGDGFEPPTFGL
jgi:hypothetical protein